MAEYDGSIRIRTMIDTGKAKEQLQALRDKAEEQTKAIDKQAQAVQDLKTRYDKLNETNLNNLENSLDKTRAKTEKLYKDYKKFISSQKDQQDPEAIKRLEQELQTAKYKTSLLIEEMKRLEQTAGAELASSGTVSPDVSSKWNELYDYLEELDVETEQIRNNLLQLGLSPEAVQEIDELASGLGEARAQTDNLRYQLEELRMNPNSSEEAQALAQEMDAARQNLSGLQQEAQGTEERIAESEQALTGWPGKIGAAVEAFKNLGSRIKDSLKRNLDASSRSASGLKKRLDNVGKSRGLQKAGKSASGLLGKLTNLFNRVKRLAERAFVFNIISRGLRSLTSLAGSYLMVNKQFADSLATIKGNLLTAFQPIYDTVMPAVNKLMEGLKDATAVAAKFVSTLFGTTAQKAQKNAQALHEQAEAAKELKDETQKAEKTLASFDTIEILGKKEEEAAEEKKPGQTAFDQAFEDVEVPEWLEEVGEKIEDIKEGLEDFFEPVKGSWDKYGPQLMDSLKYALSSIWDLISTIAKDFLKIWNSPLGQETLSLIYNTLSLIFDIIGDIAKTFKKVWEDGAGERLLTNLFTLFNTILGIIYDIALAFHNAWDNYGEQVVEALFFAVNSVLELLNSVGKAFREAWNDDGRGQRIIETIFQILSNIFNIVGELANRLKEAWEANDNGAAIWKAILDAVQAVLTFFKNLTDATLEWAKTLDLEPLVSAFRKGLEALVPLLETIGQALYEIYTEYVLPFLSKLIEQWLPSILENLASLFTWLSEHKELLKTIILAVIEFIAAWKIASVIAAIVKIISTLDPMKIVLMAISYLIILLIENWDAVKETVIKVVDSIIQAIERAKQAVKDFFSVLSGKSTFEKNKGGSISLWQTGGAFRAANVPSYDLSSVPRLAKGAVISPNSEFLAVLGDQKAGKNIEAPLSTIEQALENVLYRHGADMGTTNVEIRFTGSLSQLARVLNPQIEIARNRAGSSLTSYGGGTYGK